MTKKQAKNIYRDLVKKAFTDEVERIENFIKRAEKRGYRFPSNLVQQLTPSRITLSSVRKLRKLKPETLYRYATALDEETGKIISGTERRRQERREAAKKGWKKRKGPDNDGGYEPDDIPNISDIIWRRIQEMIAAVRASGDKKKTAEYLSKLLNDEVAQYGRDTVLRAMNNAPEEMITAAEAALNYAVGSPVHATAISTIVELITGEVLTAQQNKGLNDALEADDIFSDEGYY